MIHYFNFIYYIIYNNCYIEKCKHLYLFYLYILGIVWYERSIKTKHKHVFNLLTKIEIYNLYFLIQIRLLIWFNILYYFFFKYKV